MLNLPRAFQTWASSSNALRFWRVAVIVALATLSCVVGGSVGHNGSSILNYYSPDTFGMNVTFLASYAALLGTVIIALAHWVRLIRFAVSWLLVACALAYMWTSTTFDYDERQLADPENFGVFVVDSPKAADSLESASLTIDGSRALLEVGVKAGAEDAVVLVVVPERPDECKEYGAFDGSPAYACMAPITLQFEQAVSYNWSSPAHEAGGVSIAAAEDGAEIADLPVVSVPVDVTFETYSSDRQRIFDRPLLGVGAVDQYAITYRSDAQVVANGHWSAIVEYRFPRAVALLSMARDFALILLGGAVSLFLIPRSYTLGSRVIPAPSSVSQPGSTVRSTAVDRRRGWIALCCAAVSLSMIALIRWGKGFTR